LITDGYLTTDGYLITGMRHIIETKVPMEESRRAEPQ